MPYRRLPNTDQARLRALKAAVDHVRQMEHKQMNFSQKSALEVVSFTPLFEQAIGQLTDSKTKQVAASKQATEAGKTARLYLSHFIQVFNMCIVRGEIKPEMRSLLGLQDTAGTVPDLSTDAALIDWGHRIIDGEEKRMSQGGAGSRIYNPSIALVKVKLQIFEEHYNKHRDLLVTSQRYYEKLDEIRMRADELIVQIWNEIEATFAPIDTDEKREQCMACGVVYFYRPQERQKEFLQGGYELVSQ